MIYEVFFGIFFTVGSCSCSMEYTDKLLTVENTVRVSRVKIGTVTPCPVWVHTDDLPLEVGEYFRYTDVDPSERHEDWGCEPEFGRVTEVREQNVPLYFVESGGFAGNIEAIENPEEWV